MKYELKTTILKRTLKGFNHVILSHFNVVASSGLFPPVKTGGYSDSNPLGLKRKFAQGISRT